MPNTYTDQFKYRMPAIGDLGWDDEVNDNAIINEFSQTPVIKGNRVVEGCAPSDGGGLDVDVAAGTVVVAGTEYAITADTLTCSGSDKNYLFIDDTGTLYCTTTAPTGDYVALAMIDAGAAAIERFSDLRAMAQGALAMAIDYTPDHYTPDTSQDAPIDQHLAALDAMLYEEPRLNFFDNADFRIAQRATSQSTSGVDSIDRWLMSYTGSSTAVMSQQVFTLGQTDIPFNPKNYCRIVVTSGSSASSTVSLKQPILDLLKIAGLPTILSFWAKADSARNIAIEGLQYFGTGGSPSANVDSIDITTCNLTTAWQQFIVLFSFPSLSGKTLGTNLNTNYSLTNFWFDAGSDYNSRTNTLGNQSGTFEIADLQLLPGSDAKTFQRKDYDDSLFTCQKHCQVLPYLFWGDITTGSTYYTDTFPIRNFALTPGITATSTGNGGFPAGTPTITNYDLNKIRGYMTANATSAAGYYAGSYLAETGY